jgi:pSer/pThr/pTyr-binding forkhead associated (FHA) protein
MYAYLIYETRVLPVTGELATIGRKLDNTIVLSSKAVSRYHAEIAIIDDDYYLRDLNSSSGTFLNERRIAHPTLLQSGDFIRIADINLEFILSDDDIDVHTRKWTTPLKPNNPD